MQRNKHWVRRWRPEFHTQISSNELHELGKANVYLRLIPTLWKRICYAWQWWECSLTVLMIPEVVFALTLCVELWVWGLMKELLACTFQALISLQMLVTEWWYPLVSWLANSRSLGNSMSWESRARSDWCHRCYLMGARGHCWVYGVLENTDFAEDWKKESRRWGNKKRDPQKSRFDDLCRRSVK